MWNTQENFAFGAVSEQILALPENEVHGRALRKFENGIVGKQFKPRKVWGLRFIGGTQGNVPCYLASFEIEKFGVVILEITPGILRIYENEVVLVATFQVPYLAADLKDIWFIQANDRSNIGFIIHGDHMTRTIERRKADTGPFADEYNIERMDTNNSGPILDKRLKTVSLNMKNNSPGTDELVADEAFFQGRDAEASWFRVADRWCRGTTFTTQKILGVVLADPTAGIPDNGETGLSLGWSGPWEVDRNDAVAVTVTSGGFIGQVITLQAPATDWDIFDVGDVVDFDFTGTPNTHIAVIIKLDSTSQVKAVLITAPITIPDSTVFSGRRFHVLNEREGDNLQISVNKVKKNDTVALTANRPVFDTLMLKSGSSNDTDEPASRFHLNGGRIRITAVASPLAATGVIESDLQTRWPSTTWGQTASRWTGFASAGCFHQNRLVLTGFERFGNRFFLSRSDEFRNFRVGANENASLRLGLVNNDANFIRWCISAGTLLVGSRQAEFAIKGVPLVPTNLGSDPQSTYGGSNVQPRQVGTAILFASEDGRELREMVFRFEEDKFNAPNLADHAHNLFEGTRIKQIGFMREPEHIVWVLLDNGTLLGLSYNRDNGVVAWSPMTGRFVESIAVARGSSGDKLWMCVKRTITGGDQHYVEVMDDTNEYMDSQITEVPVAGVISGLGHLQGQKVHVLGDGQWLGDDFTVTAGQITIPSSVGTFASAVVGLEFACKVVPQAYDEYVPFDGSTLGHQKTLSQCKIKLFKTFGGEFTDDKGTVELVGQPRFPVATKMDAAVPLFTGWIHMEGVASEGEDPTYEISHKTPHPFEILIIATEVTSGSD